MLAVVVFLHCIPAAPFMSSTKEMQQNSCRSMSGGAAWACMEGRCSWSRVVAGPLASLQLPLASRLCALTGCDLQLLRRLRLRRARSLADDGGGAQASRPRLRRRPAPLTALGESLRRALGSVGTLVSHVHVSDVPFSSGALAARIPAAQRRRVALRVLSVCACSKVQTWTGDRRTC